MSDSNNNINPYSAGENLDNLDTVGKFITRYATDGVPIPPEYALLLATIVAKCRVYSTIRDRSEIGNRNDVFTQGVYLMCEQEQKRREKGSPSEVADSIIESLKADGINL